MVLLLLSLLLLLVLLLLFVLVEVINEVVTARPRAISFALVSLFNTDGTKRRCSRILAVLPRSSILAISSLPNSCRPFLLLFGPSWLWLGDDEVDEDEEEEEEEEDDEEEEEEEDESEEDEEESEAFEEAEEAAEE